MPFDTGSYTSPIDLLGKLATFATGCGWNVISGGTGGDSPGQYSFESASDGHWVHAIAENSSSRIRSMPASGYTGSGTAFNSHTGTANSSGTVANHVIMSPINGAGVNYWFFGNTSAPRYVHVVVEHTVGRFLHWSFGMLKKYGTWVGGWYDNALFWSTVNNAEALQTIPFATNSSHNADTNSKHYLRVDTLAGKASPFWETVPWVDAKGDLAGNSVDWGRHLTIGGVEPWSSRSPMAPIWAIVQPTSGDSPPVTGTILLGEVQDARVVCVDGRNERGEVMTLGADDWYVFPMREKASTPQTGLSRMGIGSTAAPNHTSQLRGLAYLRTA